MSRLDPLLDALRKTEAEELRLIAGERIHVLRSGKRQDIGREPVQVPSIHQLAAELISADDMLAVRAAPKTVRVDSAGEPVDVVIASGEGGMTVTLRAVKSAPAAQKREMPEPSQSTRDLVSGAFRAAPVTGGSVGARAIDELLRDMTTKRASDLHLSTGAHPVLRVDGGLRFLTDRPKLSSEDIVTLVKSIQNERAAREFEEMKDVDFAYAVPGLGRFRANLFVDHNGVGAVFRHIPSEIVPLEKLGLPPQAIELCNLTRGLVLVTGPTGSGKSTTIASMIDHMNRTRNDHIITIEDPVEFVHENVKCLVNQREVGAHTTSFKHALRAALREDPDIVLVGELRDLETIGIAVETAETGHLVFGSLHTTTAMSTVDRIIDQFPADRQQQIRVMLADALKGVIAQVLCKKIGGGRVAAMEILLGHTALSAMIRDGKTFQIPSIMQTSKQIGMVTLNDSLMALVQKKLITPQEAWTKSGDKTAMSLALKNAGLPTTFA